MKYADSFIDLINFMQVGEHLEIFAILKGVEEGSLKDVVTSMVDEVSLLFITTLQRYELRTGCDVL